VNKRNNVRAGIYAFAQQDDSFFSVYANDASGNSFRQRVQPTGNLEALFVEDQFKATSWLTLTGGLRYTHFDGQIAENGMDPRTGAAVQIPKLKWIVRAAYSYYYQAPPLDTVSGSLIGNTGCDGCGFLPLYGERDIQQEYGVTIPIRGWAVSETYFHTSARNFFDHDSLGNSNIFLPLTIQGAVISGLETTVRSPLLLKRYRAHVVYSNQKAQGVGAITGGLTDFYIATERQLLSGPRPAEYAFGRNGRRPAVAQLCGGDDQLRLGISEWEWPEPFAELHHVGFVAGEEFR
jgi:outer membrane receptor protein involved in Fe transport